MTEGNGMSRSEIIRELRGLLAECDEKAKNIAATRKTIKGRIKAELGFKIGDWDMMIRLAELDEGPRADLMSAIREGFSALGVGEQGSFIQALDPKPDVTEPAPKKTSKKSKAEQIAEIIQADEAEQKDREQKITDLDIELAEASA